MPTSPIAYTAQSQRPSILCTARWNERSVVASLWISFSAIVHIASCDKRVDSRGLCDTVVKATVEALITVASLESLAL